LYTRHVLSINPFKSAESALLSEPFLDFVGTAFLLPFEDWTAVATLLLWGVLQYGVNLLGVNLWDSLDFNKQLVWGVLMPLLDEALFRRDAMSNHITSYVQSENNPLTPDGRT